jgi:hypothetical protein
MADVIDRPQAAMRDWRAALAWLPRFGDPR